MNYRQKRAEEIEKSTVHPAKSTKNDKRDVSISIFVARSNQEGNCR